MILYLRKYLQHFEIASYNKFSLKSHRIRLGFVSDFPIKSGQVNNAEFRSVFLDIKKCFLIFL